MAKFCKHCGSPLEEDMIFCDNCGARQRVNPAQPAESTSDAPAHPIHPTQADISTPPTAAYSVPQPTYGYNSQPAQPYGNAPAQPEPKKSKKGLIIGLIAGAVVLIGAAVFFIFFNPFTGGSSTDDSLNSIIDIAVNSVYSKDYSADNLLDIVFEYSYASSEDDKNEIKKSATLVVNNGSMYKELYNSLGDFDISVEIIEKNRITGDEFDSFIKGLTESVFVELPTDLIKQVVKAKVKITCSSVQSDLELQETEPMYFVLVDDKWYLTSYSDITLPTDNDGPADDQLTPAIDAVVNYIYCDIADQSLSDSYKSILYDYNYFLDVGGTKDKYGLSLDIIKIFGDKTDYNNIYDEIGGKFTIKYEIVEKNLLTGKDYDEYIKGIDGYFESQDLDSYMVTTKSIQQGIEVKVNVTFTGEDSSKEKQLPLTIYLAEADGKWYYTNYQPVRS